MLQALKPEKLYRRAPRSAARSVLTRRRSHAKEHVSAVPYLSDIRNGRMYGIAFSGNRQASQKNGLPHR